MGRSFNRPYASVKWAGALFPRRGSVPPSFVPGASGRRDRTRLCAEQADIGAARRANETQRDGNAFGEAGRRRWTRCERSRSAAAAMATRSPGVSGRRDLPLPRPGAGCGPRHRSDACSRSPVRRGREVPEARRAERFTSRLASDTVRRLRENADAAQVGGVRVSLSARPGLP